jgi:hypothetical protein
VQSLKLLGLTLACLLLLSPCVLITAVSAESAIGIEWQRISGFDLNSGINGQWTITAHPATNSTDYVEFYLDEQLQLTDTIAPYSWSFNTDSYPQGQHTIKAVAHALTGETVAVSEQRSFIAFPYISIVGVLLFASIVFAFALLFTWYTIRKKAMSRRIKSKIASDTRYSSRR